MWQNWGQSVDLGQPDEQSLAPRSGGLHLEQMSLTDVPYMDLPMVGILEELLRVWVKQTSGKRGFHPLGAAQEVLHSCGLGWLSNNGCFQTTS